MEFTVLEWLELDGMSREQSSMTLDNPDDRFRRNWAISFLSIILFMFDNFLLIPFIRFSTEVVSQEQSCSLHSLHLVTSSDSTSSATPSTCSSTDLRIL